jgi:SET and MYND domain-containing protein
MDDSASSSSDSSSDDAEQWEQGGDGYSVEYSLWMLKFLCPVEGCGGTLAPPTPTAEVMEVRAFPQRQATEAAH